MSCNTLDALQYPLNLNQSLVPRPSDTFFFIVEGESGKFLGLDEGDLLVVDRTVSIAPDQMAIAVYDGQFALVQLIEEHKDLSVRLSEKSVKLFADTDLDIWGIVTGLVRQF
ncbi:LexA family transcriptional regulator [[Leptolyngbya] sp. PCC 7376]|uniref:LexA family protein n=1 Tax=[Leptolyngbya] sp. PCC 7376 TaxID=111781 RepID=UPI00059F048E|nr:S24 family peptidase [[Leptolyngbya] sp. PCC 7376]